MMEASSSNPKCFQVQIQWKSELSQPNSSNKSLKPERCIPEPMTEARGMKCVDWTV